MRRAMVAISPFASMLVPHRFRSRTTLKLFSSSLSFPSSSSSKTSASIPSSSVPSSLSSNSSDSINLEPYLGCSMQGKRLKIAILLSGGVDSSVALRFLHAAGHSCTAFYLKIWFQEDFANFWSECPWDEDLRYAKSVCDQVNVPLEIVHLSDDYWRTVISYIIGEYRVGRTPNPDILCNTRIKFGAFLESVENKGYDYIASGHYASVKHSSCGADNAFSSVLELSKDMLKDQTYFLSHLSQLQLRRLLFPLGCVSKDVVRYLATQLGLPNDKRKDSQGLCFLGKVKFSEFISRHIGELEGILLEAETGDYLGNHRGFWFYTIGQRHGLRLPGGPWFVVEKDVQNNAVFVSRNYFSLEKRRRTFRIGSLNWFSGTPPENRDRLLCKVRHGPDFYHCSIELEDKNEVAVVRLFEDDQGLAAGQFTAFYHSNICLGSGVILDSWDDSCFPVCTKAIKIARMKDRSKLGKPIRIFNLDNDSNVSLKPNGQFLDLQHIVSQQLG